MGDAGIVIITLLSIVISVYGIILFVKVWKMTGDVRVIRQMVQYGIAQGDRFKDKDGNIWRVDKFLPEGKMQCYCGKYGERKMESGDIAERL